MPTIDELMEGKEPLSVVLIDIKGSIDNFMPCYKIGKHWHGPTDNYSHGYSLDGTEDRWRRLCEPPKKLWRRPIKHKSGEVSTNLNWKPSKEEFMKSWRSYPDQRYGPWESRDDDIEWNSY